MASSSVVGGPALGELTSILRDFADYHFCPICREKSKDPVVTPCNHQFCRMCLKQVRHTKGKDRTGEKKFHCPVCMEAIGSWRRGVRVSLPNVDADWDMVKKAIKTELDVDFQGEGRHATVVARGADDRGTPRQQTELLPPKGKTPTKASRKEVPPVPPSMRAKVGVTEDEPLLDLSKSAVKKGASSPGGRRRRSDMTNAALESTVTLPSVVLSQLSASPPRKVQRKSANPRKREVVLDEEFSSTSSGTSTPTNRKNNGHAAGSTDLMCLTPCAHCRLSGGPQADYSTPSVSKREMSTQTDEDLATNNGTGATNSRRRAVTNKSVKDTSAKGPPATPKGPKGRPRKKPVVDPATPTKSPGKAKPTPQRQASAMLKSPSSSEGRGSSSLASTEDSDNETQMNTQEIKQQLHKLREHVSKKEEEEAAAAKNKSRRNSSSSSASNSGSGSESSRDSGSSSSSSNSGGGGGSDDEDSKSVFSPTQKSNSNQRLDDAETSDEDMFSSTPQRSNQRSSFLKASTKAGGGSDSSKKALSTTNGKRKKLNLSNDLDSDSDDFDDLGPTPLSIKKKRGPKKRKLISSGNGASSSTSTLFDMIAKTARPMPAPKPSTPQPPTLPPVAPLSSPENGGLKVLSPVEARRLVLLGSGIREEQMRKLEAFRKSADCTLKKLMDPAVTHLVVNHDDDLKAERTLKFLQAVATGKFVVGISWVRKCLEDNTVYDPAPYEVHDQDGDPGPQRGRIAKKQAGKSKRNLLFSKYQFYLHGDFRAIARDQVKRLLEECGGVVVRSETGMSFAAGTTPLIMVDKDCVADENECLMMFCRTDVAVVDKDWMIDCIGRYAITPIHSANHTHLQHEASVERLKECGYKNKIIHGDNRV